MTATTDFSPYRGMKGTRPRFGDQEFKDSLVHPSEKFRSDATQIVANANNSFDPLAFSKHFNGPSAEELDDLNGRQFGQRSVR